MMILYNFYTNYYIFITREKKLSRNCGIKVLNHAMTGVEGSDNCQKFVDILGLRTVFPLFMKTPKQAKAGPPPEELEGILTLSLIQTLWLYIQL